MYNNNIKEISIKEFLNAIGVTPEVEKPHYGMYISPIRAEQNASLRVDYDKNLWYDHGIGVGCSIIDLVMHLEKCDFRSAVANLKNRNFHKALHVHISNFQPSTANTGIMITAVLPIQSQGLLYYLEKRAITLYIAQKYCHEVRYTVGEKEYFAIGFRNDAGGYELRSRYFKGCSTPKNITTIANGSDSVMVFEGFIDFLSYLSLKENPSPIIDTTVLNSVANLAKAIPFLQEHKTVYAFLDNDEAGKRAVEKLRQFLPNSEVVDQSAFYRNHKDLNDYLVAQRLAKYTLQIAKPPQNEVVKIKPRGRKQ